MVIVPETNMVRPLLLVCFVLLVPLSGNAEEVHKCVTAEGTTYQGLPCDGREAPLSAAQAEEYVKHLQEQKRYQRDVY